ncbi:pentatricopeptide repeat domain-containing protein [Colletotrichum orchidophilum]|uniref:Pentatricopeptide repeat domain-containing protein n=1 Tax=Colletotrichum orchidophilum TaxID=1209926 RepID=A0A1G4B279_9PEZI|nr:pentatricopeptide repeat domain-containing protein [Colletotrichum orchidophilum]OHE95520.1 pentatricopeptide repeat domain-containing protein [Colletotrichum orchidophilum]
MFDLEKERHRTYLEHGYLRHHLTKKELKDFNNWKNDVKRLYAFASFGDAYKIPEILKWILDRRAVEEAIEQWENWTDEQRKTKWRKLMFSALWSCPDRAAAVLETTTRGFMAPGYAISDVIHFLSKWQSQRPVDEFKAHAEILCDVVVTVFNRFPPGYVAPRQNTIWQLTNGVDLLRTVSLYKCLKEKNVLFHSNTLRNIAKRLAASPQHKHDALQMAIEAIPEQGTDLDSGAWSALCTSILSLRPGQINTDDGFSAADAFVILLEHGFAPNMVHYTAVIRSLCLTDQNEIAEEVFQTMQRHNIEPDIVLWSTLLDGGKRALSPSNIESVVKGALGGNDIDVPFLNDLLVSLLHFCKAEPSKNTQSSPGYVAAFGPMLHFYSKIFHMAPLQALIPVDLSMYLDGQQRLDIPAKWQLAQQLFPALDMAMSAVQDKLDPTDATLSIMFLAYVRSLTQPINLISLYAYFRQEISKGSPIATKLVREKGTFAYDVLIKALCAFPGMLRAALDIVGDMLKSTLEERSKAVDAMKQSLEGSEVTPPPLHPAPSVFTWSILLHGFSREKGSGERILAQMRQYGVEPNLVTWNTLIAGYARNQDVNKTVLSLQRLEASGHEADDFTLRAFSRLVNRELALKKMENALTKRAAQADRKEAEDKRMASIISGSVERRRPSPL